MLARIALRASFWPRSNATLKIATAGRCQLTRPCSQHHGTQNQLIFSSHLRPRLGNGRLHPLTIHRDTRRPFLTDTLSYIPTILIPPVVFIGLLLTLWTYKCLMMILFQDKIIYMPYMPPFARSETIDDYVAACKPVEWETQSIKSLDGTKLSLCIGKVPDTDTAESKEGRVKEVVICYFQGNGGSLPPRLPILSSVLKSVHARSMDSGRSVRYTLVALSYRGYWTSSGRATQSGIELDAQAFLEYITTSHFSNSDQDIELILWGQSIGAGVATTAAATYLSTRQVQQTTKPYITGLVLETPFSSTKNMLLALYPQKWLPYRYLSPFLWNRWDSIAALRKISGTNTDMPKVLLVPATKDELVPAEEANTLEELCRELGFSVQRKDVEGALHNETTIRRDGQLAISKFIVDASLG